VIDLHSGEERLRLTTPDREPLLPLAFSGDGRRFTAVSLDSRRLLIWDRQEIQRGLARYGLAETIGSQHGNGDLANEIRVNLGPFRDRYLAWRALERRQDFVQAASHLRDAIAKHPDDHDSRIRLVQICLFGPAEVRDVAFAEKLCDELLARIQSTAPEQRSFLPTLSMTSALRAGVEFRREKYADALAWLEKSNRNPSSSFTSHLLLRGLSLHRLGQTEQAKRYLEDCDQLIYWESNNNHWLGILYRNLREEPGNPPTTLRR
jgi:tetratricopeptide (TPR) repeat protein